MESVARRARGASRSRRRTARRSASPAIATATRARWCWRPATATRRARSPSTRCRRTGSSTSASTAGTCGCSTTARAPTCRRAPRSSPSTTSRCATGRRRSRSCAARPRADSVQAMGHCIGGLTLFMALGGGMEGVRAATISAVAGHPGPDARQPAAGVGAGPDDHEGARDQDVHQRLRPALLERPRRRGADADRAVPAHLQQPRRAPDLLHVRRRLPVREHQPRDDGAGGAELLRRQQHDVLRAHGRDGAGGPRARRPRRATRTWRTSTRSSSRSSS